tara:strand:+ start:57 stop:212 length:156 start_codon:yes stop_codon:yes gene_type:complete
MSPPPKAVAVSQVTNVPTFAVKSYLVVDASIFFERLKKVLQTMHKCGKLKG